MQHRCPFSLFWWPNCEKRLGFTQLMEWLMFGLESSTYVNHSVCPPEKLSRLPLPWPHLLRGPTAQQCLSNLNKLCATHWALIQHETRQIQLHRSQRGWFSHYRFHAENESWWWHSHHITTGSAPSPSHLVTISSCFPPFIFHYLPN